MWNQNETYFSEWFGLEYFVFQNTNVLKKTNIDDLVIQHYALLLPLLPDINNERNESTDRKIMTLTNSEWKEMDKGKKYV